MDNVELREKLAGIIWSEFPALGIAHIWADVSDEEKKAYYILADRLIDCAGNVIDKELGGIETYHNLVKVRRILGIFKPVDADMVQLDKEIRVISQP